MSKNNSRRKTNAEDPIWLLSFPQSMLPLEKCWYQLNNCATNLAIINGVPNWLVCAGECLYSKGV